MCRVTESGLRVFLDATLMVQHGLLSPIGLVRVEHYLAEFLAEDPLVDLHFVIYDRAWDAYRPLNGAEQEMLQQILYHRYETSAPATGAPAAELADAEPPAAAELPEVETPVVELPDAEAPVAPAPFGRLSRLRHGLGRVSRMSRGEFGVSSSGFVRRCLPIRPDHPPLLRVGICLTRRLALIGARRTHQVLRLATRLTAADVPLVESTVAADEPTPVLQVTNEEAEEAEEAMVEGVRPGPGDVLICTGNVWEYMNYAYLDRLCRGDGVRLVSVIYDVIAMEFPFTTPGPPHIYHRHWVEIGHLSSHLLAISQHSVRTYQRFIAEPNDLTTPISHAYLPNFLKEHAAAIGEVPIVDLEGRPFVVYVSTIEIRKNHQLLLNAWDRLRQEMSDDRLPVLVFVGKWAWGTETVRLLAERNWRLRTHLRVLDRVSDGELIWLYRNARFTVFPSHSEGFGLGAAESLSFGTPVVVSDCPALVEASEGLMPAHAPLDFVAWYKEIHRLATDDARLDELRAAAERYRGPGYDEFACALRDVARRAVAQ